MRFIEWIARLKDNLSPTGDLARDILADKTFPKSNDKAVIKDYLQNNGACDGAMSAFNSAWKSYQAYMRTHP